MSVRRSEEPSVTRILVTGASGIIGGALLGALSEFRPIALWNRTQVRDPSCQDEQIDLRDEHATRAMIRRHDPDVVFHLAALTSPKRNEEDPVLARQSHGLVTANVLHELRPDTRVIFLSTDKVFDGTNRCPRPADTVSPSHLYGQLKVDCENMIRNACPNHCILRIPIVHGYRELDPRLFLDSLIKRGCSGETVTAFSNVLRSFVRLDELVMFLCTLARSSKSGTFHVGTRMTSYFDRVIQICTELGIRSSMRIESAVGTAVPIAQGLDTEDTKRVFDVEFH
jgi:dTDP-4-dehydrorhamnose reductase